MHASLNKRGAGRSRTAQGSTADPPVSPGLQQPIAGEEPTIVSPHSLLREKQRTGMQGNSVVTSPQEPEVSRLVISTTGVEWHVPRKKRVVRLRPASALALLLVPCIVVAAIALNTRQAGTALSSSLQTISHSLANVGTYFTSLYAKYRAPILRRGVIYDDALRNSWVLKRNPHQDITLKATHSMAAPYQGTQTIRVHFEKPLDALRLKSPPEKGIELNNYSQLKFAIHGGTVGNQHLFLRTEVDGKTHKTLFLAPPMAGKWETMKLSLARIAGRHGRLTGITIFSEHPQPVFYVDNLRLE
jgi:hypothetical protein